MFFQKVGHFIACLLENNKTAYLCIIFDHKALYYSQGPGSEMFLNKISLDKGRFNDFEPF